MKVFAVISEFNPFHSGHKHLIDALKKDGDCAVIAIMSGSFVERGDVAVIDKYARAEAAVRCGIDLVLELPAPWCFSGAEFFALGGVSIADALGVVDTLAFGSEVGDSEELMLCAKRLVSDELSQALSRAREARPEASSASLLVDVYGSLYGDASLLGGSNNILALEYIKAIFKLESTLSVKTVKREGEEYNSAALLGICSATAIREAISEGRRDFERFMPQASLDILLRELEAGRKYDLSHLDTAVIARLRTCEPSELSDIMEMSGGMENRICSLANSVRGIDELVESVRDRRYSRSRIRRALLGAMLGVTMRELDRAPEFTAVLAANEKGREVLSLARKKTKIPILSKISAGSELSGATAEQFARHMKAERLAELCCEGEPRRVGAVML